MAPFVYEVGGKMHFHVKGGLSDSERAAAFGFIRRWHWWNECLAFLSVLLACQIVDILRVVFKRMVFVVSIESERSTGSVRENT
ncbi:MAG: hypothetical protein CMJ78_22475 [Planctomycetaceae bacterium]|nr:hypothetical protein [Planctomycetaceae bacterium]